MKKIFPAVFALFCVAVCLVPSLGMIVRPTTEPIGNERKSKAPELTKKDGSFNFSYLTDLGGYYEKHFAFRPEMITADATVQAPLPTRARSIPSICRIITPAKRPAYITAICCIRLLRTAA